MSGAMFVSNNLSCEQIFFFFLRFRIFPPELWDDWQGDGTESKIKVL